MRFEFRDVLGNVVEVSSERVLHVIDRHPEMLGAAQHIESALTDPDFVIVPTDNDDRRIYYRRHDFPYHSACWLSVVVVAQAREFVVTAYATDYIKPGRTLWSKHQNRDSTTTT